MTKIISVLLSIMMMFTLVACNTGDGDTAEATDTAAATDTATGTPSTPDIAGTTIGVSVTYTETALETFQDGAFGNSAKRDGIWKNIDQLWIRQK